MGNLRSKAPCREAAENWTTGAAWAPGKAQDPGLDMSEPCSRDFHMCPCPLQDGASLEGFHCHLRKVSRGELTLASFRAGPGHPGCHGWEGRQLSLLAELADLARGFAALTMHVQRNGLFGR